MGRVRLTRDRARAAIFEYVEVFDNRAGCAPPWGSYPPVFERAHSQTHR